MQDPGGARELRIDADAQYNWSVGARMERFIRGLGERKLLGIRCPSCNRVFIPPRMICGKCFEQTEEWVEVGPEGTVEGYTVGYVSVDDDAGGLRSLSEPEVVALVKPDGADSSMVHRIGGAGPDEIEVSMRVKAVWADKTAGDLADLVCFGPVT
jgi:uncharacterized OB-fold protein